MPDLSKLTLLIVDSGYFTFVATEMARYYGKVLYCRPTISVFLESRQHSIGKGLPGVEWVDELEPSLDRADIILFCDVNFGPLQVWLQGKGYRVCGALGGEKMEQDKYFALGRLASAGLNIPKSWAFVPQNGKAGLDSAWTFLSDKHEKLWIKPADKYRGDIDTTAHYHPRQTEIDFNAIRQQIGIVRAQEVGVIVQKDIPDAIEIGPDLFRNGAEISSTFSIGVEDKGMGYLGRKFSEPPPIMKDFFDKTATIYGEVGYQGPYSSEMRITPDGKVFALDECCRMGNPPTAGLIKFYGKDYALAVYDCAHGITPVIDSKNTHFGEIILRCDKYNGRDIYVPVPPELRDWLMLKNARQDGEETYCVENGTYGQFASIIATGNSIKEVAGLLDERVQRMTMPRLEYLSDYLGVMLKKVAKAKEYAGIDLNG